MGEGLLTNWTTTWADTRQGRPAAYKYVCGSTGSQAMSARADTDMDTVGGHTMDELVGLLTRERLLLERLLFRATELRMMLGADPRFVAWASHDLTTAADALRDAELRRAVLYSKIAEDFEWPSEPFDWDLLGSAMGEPHSTILTELRETLSSLTVELQGQLEAVRQMGEAGLAGVTEFLESLASPEALVNAAVAGDRKTGPWAVAQPTPRVDRQL